MKKYLNTIKKPPNAIDIVETTSHVGGADLLFRIIARLE
jgi:hypothetical protein